jgi:hypothetical protein
MGGYWLKYKKKGMAKLEALSLEYKHLSKKFKLATYSQKLLEKVCGREN